MFDVLEIKRLKFAFIVAFSDLHNSFMQIPPPFLMFWTNTASLDGDFDYIPSFTSAQANCAQEKSSELWKSADGPLT